MPGIKSFSVTSSVPHRDFRFRLRAAASSLSCWPEELDPDPKPIGGKEDGLEGLSPFFLANVAFMLAISSMLGILLRSPPPPGCDDVPNPDPLGAVMTLGGPMLTAEEK
jgi:hypothetical protein